MTHYRRGLKKYVKEELLRTGARVENLDDLVKEAISINDKWHDFAMESRYDRGIRGYSGISGRSSFGGGYQTKKSYGQPSTTSDLYYRTVPMEIDIIGPKHNRRKRGEQY